MGILHCLNLRDDYFHGELSVSNGNSTPPEKVQEVILNVILNVPESTQITIPVFRCRDVNGTEILLEIQGDETQYDNYGFHAVPQTVRVLWHPYGTVEMTKVKEILDEEVERHLFRPDIVRKTVQYSWKFRWDRSFADRIIYDAKQFALRVRTHLQEELRRKAKAWSDNHDYIRVEIRNDYISFHSSGSGSSYITFKDEGLVDLDNAIQVLGCAYAVLECAGNSHEWEITPFCNGYSGCRVWCSLKGHRKAALKQW